MGERQRFTAEEKARMVLEIIQDGKKISEVAEENSVHPNQLISWKKTVSWECNFSIKNRKNRYKRKGRTKENCQPERRNIEKGFRHSRTYRRKPRDKKLFWPDIKKMKAGLILKKIVEAEIDGMHKKTGISITALLRSAGIFRSTWFAWKTRMRSGAAGIWRGLWWTLTWRTQALQQSTTSWNGIPS